MAKELKRFLDAKKTDPRLIGDVERHLLQLPPSSRRTDVLHPSEIIKPDWCHRYSWYLLNGGEKKQENPGLRLQNVFDEGHAIHDKWQKRFQDMGVLWGKFKCHRCSKISTGQAPVTCKNCQSKNVFYQEVTLIDDSHRISGSTDGWIKGIGDDCLIEIKSIGAGTFRWEAPDLLMDADNDPAKAWKNIRRPFRSHLLQGQMYLELARRMYGDAAPKEIVFIYEFKADQDIKEFTSKADFEIVFDA
jgi:DNA-directed RNA polymerase subunit RPC12/RpoP